jgi:hypothetical protein
MKSSYFSKKFLFCIFFFSLILRIFYIWGAVKGDLSWPKDARGNEVASIAANIALGNGYSSPFEPGNQPTAWIPPLVPYIWAAIFKLFGVLSTESLFVIYCIQALLRAFATVLYANIIGVVCQRASISKKTLPSVLVLITTVWPENNMILIQPWYFVYLEVLLCSIVLLSFKLLDRPYKLLNASAAELQIELSSQKKEYVLLGILTGCVCNINPVPTLYVAWICILGFFLYRKYAPWYTFEHIKLTSLALLISVVLVMPWLIRCYTAFQKFIPMRSNFGVELWLGNNPQLSSIVITLQTPHPTLDDKELSIFNSQGEIKYADEKLTAAKKYIFEQPGSFILRTLSRFYVYWCSDIIGNWTFRGRKTDWSIERGYGVMARKVIRVTQYLFCCGLFLFLCVTGTVKKIPFSQSFLGLFLLLPLPYYVTQANEFYTHPIQYFMLIFVGLGVLVKHYCPSNEDSLNNNSEFYFTTHELQMVGNLSAAPYTRQQGGQKAEFTRGK